MSQQGPHVKSLRSRTSKSRWFGSVLGLLIATAGAILYASRHPDVLSVQKIHTDSLDRLPAPEHTERTAMGHALTVPVRVREPEIDGPGLIRDARPHMLDQNPDLAQFRWIERKILRTREEQELRREMFKDLELISYTRDRLLMSRTGPLTREDEIERLYRVEFLSSAIEELNNPARDAVVSAIDDVIMAHNIRADMPLELQRSLTGDKMELYMALLHDAPEHAEELAKTAKETAVEGLIRYASTKYQAWNKPDDHE